MTGAPLHIALSFDDRFWAPAFAVMRAIALSSPEPETLNFHLFHIGLAPRHLDLLNVLANQFPLRITHVDLKTAPAYLEFVRDLPIARPFTPVIYARLLLDALLPATIERVIYLDCDMLVRAPLAPLAALDLEGKAIAAVLDPHRHRYMLGRDLVANADQFDFAFPYFNSGLMVIDRKAYGKANVPALTRKLYQTGVLARLQYDQAILNLAFKDNWLPLEFRWNLINPQRAHENFEPHIVHYTGHKKPWHLLSQAAFAAEYRHTMTNAVFYQFWRERLRRRVTTPVRAIGRRR